MTGALARRLDRIEAARMARALGDFRRAFHDWALRPETPQTAEEAEARLAAMCEPLTPDERRQSERLERALWALLEPATPPAAVARAAASIAAEAVHGLQPGAPSHVVLAVLAGHFRAPD